MTVGGTTYQVMATLRQRIQRQEQELIASQQREQTLEAEVQRLSKLDQEAFFWTTKAGKADHANKLRDKEQTIQRLQDHVEALESQQDECRCANKRAWAGKSSKGYWKRGTGLVLGSSPDTSSSWGYSSSSSNAGKAKKPHYMMNTSSSRAKLVPSKAFWNEYELSVEPFTDSTSFDCDTTSTWVSTLSTPQDQEAADHQPNHPVSLADNPKTTDNSSPSLVQPCHLPTDIMPEGQWSSLLSERLGHRPAITAYVDDRWLAGYAGNIILPSKFCKTMLQDAADLAAEMWYNWGLQHQPEFMNTHAPEGPWDLLLDRSTLIDRSCGGFGERASSTFSPSRILFEKIPDLRNACSHFDSTENVTPTSIFRLIHPVLEFANSINDSIGAEKIKTLLKALYDEACETYDSIEKRIELTTLPDARPWAPHHLKLFKVAKEALSKEDDSGKPQPHSYGPAVVRAASNLDWHMQAYAGPGWKGNTSYTESDSTINLARELGYSPSSHDPTKWEKLQSDGRRLRRQSFSGSDCNAWTRSRWRCRREPRVTLIWADLAMTF